MPISDDDEQRIASREAMARLRERRKAEAEATRTKFEETIPLDAEHLNYKMEPTKEKPMDWDAYRAEHPDDKKSQWIRYKIAWSYEHGWKGEKESEDKRKMLDEQSKYGTREHPCVLWRRMFEKQQKSDFYYNHIDSCKSCMEYYAKQKNKSAFDLNDTKDKQHFEELDGYASVFAEPKPFPEDFIGYPYPMPMNKICPNCLSNLRPDGTCPNGCEKAE